MKQPITRLESTGRRPCVLMPDEPVGRVRDEPDGRRDRNGGLARPCAGEVPGRCTPTTTPPHHKYAAIERHTGATRISERTGHLLALPTRTRPAPPRTPHTASLQRLSCYLHSRAPPRCVHHTLRHYNASRATFDTRSCLSRSAALQSHPALTPARAASHHPRAPLPPR